MVRMAAVLALLVVWSCGRSAEAGELKDSVRQVLDKIPVSKYDLDEPAEKRSSRLDMVASAIAGASRHKQHAALLLALGQHESAFARYVGDGCRDVPTGGPNCDRGLARSYWQMHARACRAGWLLDRGDPKATAEFAKCAVRQLDVAKRRCLGRHPGGPIAGAFSGYAGASCSWQPAFLRAKTFRRRLAQLSR